MLHFYISKIWTGGKDHKIYIWDLEQIGNEGWYGQVPFRKLPAHREEITCMLRVGDTVWSASLDCTLRIWSKVPMKIITIWPRVN